MAQIAWCDGSVLPAVHFSSWWRWHCRLGTFYIGWSWTLDTRDFVRHKQMYDMLDNCLLPFVRLHYPTVGFFFSLPDCIWLVRWRQTPQMSLCYRAYLGCHRKKYSSLWAPSIKCSWLWGFAQEAWIRISSQRFQRLVELPPTSGRNVVLHDTRQQRRRNQGWLPRTPRQLGSY